LILWQKRTSRKRSKNGGYGGTGFYMREGTSSRVMAADGPYGEFYDFYSASPEYFGYTLITHIALRRRCLSTKLSLHIRINTSRDKGLIFFSETSRRLCSRPSLLASMYRCSFPEADWPGSAADQSRPSSVCVKNDRSHTSTRYRKINPLNTTKRSFIGFTGQLVSTQLWGHHQASD
jgi:hypothetical protein